MSTLVVHTILKAGAAAIAQVDAKMDAKSNTARIDINKLNARIFLMNCT
jgi:hypothetical protein